MLNPIVLTEFNETLIEDPNRSLNENMALICCVGIHKECHGHIKIIPVSETHSALCCQYCGLRVVIPKEVRTYADLREWCAINLNRIKERRRTLADIIEDR